MELLSHLPAAPLVGIRRARRARRLGLAASLAAHAALVGSLAVASFGPPAFTPDQPVTVEIIAAEVSAAAPERASSAPPPPERSTTPRVKRPTLAVVAATPAPERAPEEPEPPPAAADARQPTAQAPAVVADATGVSDSVTVPAGGGTGAPGTATGRGRVAPAAGGGADRRALLERYTKLLAPRIKQHLRYPPQAEVLEIEGAVLVRVAVDARGQVVRARPDGMCPHEILCDDAVRTVRASAPFPSPPPELGAVVEVHVPLNYAMP
jgi:protein TonB